MSSQCCLTYVELLSGEKEVVRRWLRDEMTTFLDPLVDTLFNRLEASLMSNGAVPNQFGGGAGCGCGCGQLVMNGNDGQMHQPSFVIAQPSSSHHLNIQQNVQNVHYSYQQQPLSINNLNNDYYLNQQQQLSMTTPNFVHQPMIAPNAQLNYNDPTTGQAYLPSTIPHQINPTSPSQLNTQNVIPNYQSPSPSSEPMDLRFNRESSSTEPSVPSSPGSMDNRSSDDQSSTSDQISLHNENVQSFPIQDEIEVTNSTVQPSSSTLFHLNPQYVQSKLPLSTSPVPPPLTVSITSGQITLPKDSMIGNELTNVQSFQVPIQNEIEVTPNVQPSSTSFQLNPQYVQSQFTSPTPQVPPPRMSMTPTNDQMINFPNKLTNIQSHPIQHEILVKTSTLQPTSSTAIHLKHSTPPPNGRKSNPLTARQSLSLVKREPIDEEHDETQLMEDDNPHDRHTIKLNFDFTESMYSDAFDDDEDDQLLKCRHSGCQFQTAHAYQLRTHERTHSGVKPFRCKWPRCDYAAIRKSEVLGHIRRHFALEPSSNGAQLDPKDFLEVVHNLL